MANYKLRRVAAVSTLAAGVLLYFLSGSDKKAEIEPAPVARETSIENTLPEDSQLSVLMPYCVKRSHQLGKKEDLAKILNYLSEHGYAEDMWNALSNDQRARLGGLAWNNDMNQMQKEYLAKRIVEEKEQEALERKVDYVTKKGSDILRSFTKEE